MNENISRHHISSNIRSFLTGRGYIEVVSPILRNHNSKINPRFSVESQKYLRDCMELELRKKVSKVCPKVFEIGPCFRKDKEDDSHKAEFYMMELYSLGEGLEQMIDLMMGAVTACMSSVDDVKRISVREYILIDLGVDISLTDTATLIQSITSKWSGIAASGDYPYQTVNRYIETHIETTLTKRGCLYFLEEYPLCTITIASRKGNSNCIQRFECFINGLEVSNAFEDCMDPNDLRVRLGESGIMAEEETELLSLVESGSIPPTVGLGIGIDRLCMLNIRGN